MNIIAIIAFLTLTAIAGMLAVKIKQQEASFTELKSRFTRLCLSCGQASLGYGEIRPIAGECSMVITMQGGAGGGGGSGKPLGTMIAGRGGDGWRPKSGPLIDWYNGLSREERMWVDGENYGQPGTITTDPQGRQIARGGKGGRSIEAIHQEWMQRQQQK